MVYVANENGTMVFTMVFTDSTGTVVVPTTRAFQLMKKDGTIVNSRTFAAGSFSGNTVVLSGDDLALDSVGDVERIFAVQTTYTSDLGAGLTANEETEFIIRNLYSQS